MCSVYVHVGMEVWRCKGGMYVQYVHVDVGVCATSLPRVACYAVPAMCEWSTGRSGAGRQFGWLPGTLHGTGVDGSATFVLYIQGSSLL